MKYKSSFILHNKDIIPTLKYYVYAIYLPGKTNPSYIGKGQGDRWRHYFYYPEKVANRILRKKLVDLKEAGIDYHVAFLYETNDEKECLDVESFYISYYGRVYNKTGILYNFDIESVSSGRDRPSKRKPIYIDGFIYDSVTRAKNLTGIKQKTIRNYCKNGRAAYLDNPDHIKLVEDRNKELKYHYFYKRHIKAIKRAKKAFLISEGRRGKDNWMYGKATAISKRIEVDGVVYRSLNKAAEAHGFGGGYSFKRMLLRGNHNHTWKILD